jgi:GNAT superfamily N-acetyltransferase
MTQLWLFVPIQYLPDCERLLPEQLAAKTRLGAWHLHEIATAPEHQRKGVARALIDAVKEQVSCAKSVVNSSVFHLLRDLRLRRTAESLRPIL